MPLFSDTPPPRTRTASVFAAALLTLLLASGAALPATGDANGDIILRFNQAALYEQAGNYTQAIAEFTTVLALHTNDADATISRGGAYGQMVDADRTLAEYSHALILNPTDAPAYFGPGLVYAMRGDNDRAITQYTRAAADLTQAWRLTRMPAH